jgi:hypothetical protein
MTGIQLIAIVFGVGMAFWTYRAYRRKDLLGLEAAVWLAVWVGLILVSVFPDALRNVVGPLKVARLLDLVMIVGILLLSTMVFLLNGRVRRLERRMVDLVRRLALSAEESPGNREESIGEVHRDPGQAAK